MTTRRIRLVVATVAALVALPGSASAAIQDASEPPRTSGPLVGSPLGCEDNGAPESPGEVRMQTCVWSYELLPAETNAGEDYSGYWIQIDAEAAPGWCIYGVQFDTSGPRPGRLVSAVPGSGKSGGETTVELAVDAEGAAPVPGTIAQDVAPPRGRVTTRLTDDRFAYEWSGKTSKKLVLAMGVQIADPVVPELLTSWSEGGGFTIGSCRPLVIRTGR